ncbi:homoserine dehydrogenase [Methanothermobacter marburgensis]|uniref:Homoserine dehydrogenase n=1 Tax=Methanothermobacter marburgensis (strain ATCC BAA-927 / DSM 2133 / JCM 14651 / NBRC 100331 / OCM 82 / Marburg) TaxID=79929 RepID=D9PYA1_METTM|nr:homoserine dehydrogenase [Methanothermobacter marburgensis]ADL59199.1 predicted homoserine dehydrogenase [Methanothermobacter marburgensis str. Marburg]WBF09705.1 homoserine dehydrogenase [Methanothermobacter marburgensis]
MNVGLIGFGTIGAGVVEIFNTNHDLIREKTGKDLKLKRVVDLDIETDRGVDIDPEILSTDADDILNDPEIDIVIELIGGYEPARSFILRALENGKHVVTANKALLARHWDEIMATARENGVRIAFEASVGGGIPVLRALNESLAANRIKSIYGIINGTANYILTRMASEGMEFDDVLREAQRLGYAERDPTFDIEGHDTAQKLIILALLGFGVYVPEEDLHVEGISKIRRDDIEYANNELGCSVKLLATASLDDGELEMGVMPFLVPHEHLLSSVNGVFNGIYITGDFTGPVMFYGKGAGRRATASAVVADCMDIALNPESPLQPGPGVRMVESIREFRETRSRYYIRLDAVDRPGVLHEIAGAFSRHEISIESVTQKGALEGESVPIYIVTHEAAEGDIQSAIREISEIRWVTGEPVRLKIL